VFQARLRGAQRRLQPVRLFALEELRLAFSGMDLRGAGSQYHDSDDRAESHPHGSVSRATARDRVRGMKNQATYDDANLILKLYDLRREPRLRDARKWFGGAPQFQSREEWLKLVPPGSDENASYRMVVTYWEMVSSLVASGVLNAELFYASNLEMLFVWEKIRVMLPEIRAVQKNPMLYHNLEQVAAGFIEHMTANSPEWYASYFAPMIAKAGR
jgi:hypothetical protein